MQMGDLLDIIVVKIQEDQSRQAHQVFNFLNVVMLKIEQTEAFLTLQERHVSEVSLVQVQPIGVGVSL